MCKRSIVETEEIELTGLTFLIKRGGQEKGQYSSVEEIYGNGEREIRKSMETW